MNKRRVLEVLAMLMIGEGVLMLLFPRNYLLLWKCGTTAFGEAVEDLAERPCPTRVIGLIEALVGLWLAYKQQPR